MAQPEKRPDIDRRRFMRDALFALAGAAMGALAAEGIDRRLDEQPETPLEPESGEAVANLNIEWLPPTVKRWSRELERYAEQYQTDPNLAAIIMTIESGGDPRADSGVARGLMQITDPRATDIAAKFLTEPRSSYDLFDPETSIEFGIANIKHLTDTFGEPKHGPSWDATVGLVAAGYYAGEGGAMAYRDQGLTGIEDQGTYNYIRYVTTMWRERHDDKSFAYRYWHDQGNGRALIEAARQYRP